MRSRTGRLLVATCTSDVIDGVENGVLLFGISTAFLFAVIQAHWQLLSHRRER
jgi:hypothetical protein